MDKDYYQNKSLGYGIGHTRLRRILELGKGITGKKVLDVGCARGYLGYQFKLKGNYVAGVEISEEAAREAEKKLDRVYMFDIGKIWPASILDQKFDLIIMSETLEHVFKPVDVLKNVRQVLSDDGEIIITTPNFMTWTNRDRFYSVILNIRSRVCLILATLDFLPINT